MRCDKELGFPPGVDMIHAMFVRNSPAASPMNARDPFLSKAYVTG
jgi:hypothetical protein